MKRLALLFLCLAGSIFPATLAAGREFGPPKPFTSIALSQLGYKDDTLRGTLVSADWFIPGPADFLLGAKKPGDSSYVDLEYIPSELLTQESVMVVSWNGTPVYDAEIGATDGSRQRVRVRIPFERIDPEINRMTVQAQLRLAIDTCEAGSVDSPARHLTILASTTVAYSFAEPVEPRPAPVQPDLGSYPAPFFSSTHPQPAPVRFIVPDDPTPTELTAFGRVAAQLGQYAGDRGLKVELLRSSQVPSGDLARTHLVLVGKLSRLPMLQTLGGAPVAHDRSTFLDAAGKVIPEDTGVIEVMPSPASAARGLLVVSGVSDRAVEKAALAISGRDAIKALHGTFALVQEAEPFRPASTTPVTTLADLGFPNEQVNGVGDHAISFTAFLPSIARDGSVPLDLAVSHSALLDQNRSSMRLIVNGLPLESVAFRDLPPVHGVRTIDLPGAALKPGANSLRIEFSLRLPGLAERDSCNAVPVEQAWAVLHADSAIHTPRRVQGGVDPQLSTYPFPFHRDGRIDDVVVVVPSDFGANQQALAQFISDLGRGTRARLLRPTFISARSFDPAKDAIDKDVIVFGLPPEEPVLSQLSQRLPVSVSGDQRLVLAREITVRVEDLQRLGVVEEIASPWSAGRAVLVVTGSSAEGLDYAVEAVRQRALSGNVVISTRRQERAPVAGAAATPAPLSFGGPSSIPLEVSSYQLRPVIVAAQQEVRPPWVLIAAGVVALLALLLVAAQFVGAARAAEDREG